MVELTEIRVHGVGGASVAQLLGAGDIEQVDGDGTAGFFRRRDDNEGHTEEAYVWGGLTSKALITGFWWLLLPFTLVNVAGWMLQPDKQGRRGPLMFTRGMVRLGGVGLTVAYVLYISVLFVDVIAVRCGSDAMCTRRWWLTPLRWFPVGEVGHPVWRAVAGTAAVLVLVTILFGVSARNRRLHESYRPASAPDTRPKAGRIFQLADADFWYQLTSPGALYRTHLAAATMTVGFVAGTSLEQAAAGPGWPDDSALRNWLIVLGIATTLVIGFLAKPDRYSWEDDGYTDRSKHEPDVFRAAIVGWAAFHVALTIVAGLLGAAWRRNTTNDDFAEHGFITIVSWMAYGVGVLIFVLLGAGVVRQWFSNLGHIGSFLRQLWFGFDKITHNSDEFTGRTATVLAATRRITIFVRRVTGPLRKLVVGVARQIRRATGVALLAVLKRTGPDRVYNIVYSFLDESPTGIEPSTESRAGFRIYPVPAALGLGLILVFAGFSGVLIRTIAWLETDETTVELQTSLIGGNSSFFALAMAVTTAVVAYWYFAVRLSQGSHRGGACSL